VHAWPDTPDLAGARRHLVAEGIGRHGLAKRRATRERGERERRYRQARPAMRTRQALIRLVPGHRRRQQCCCPSGRETGLDAGQAQHAGKGTGQRRAEGRDSRMPQPGQRAA
jgi:hypothetical protein